MKAIMSVEGTIDTLHTHEFQLIVCVPTWMRMKFPPFELFYTLSK